MTRYPLLIAAGVLVTSLPACAEKLLVRMGPQSLAHEGFKISTKQEDGLVRFQLTRDLSKTRWQGHSAGLTISGESGIIARCAVEGEKLENVLTYRFSIAPQYVRHSRLTYSDIQTDPRSKLPLIGGGTIYEFNLADYLPRAETN